MHLGATYGVWERDQSRGGVTQLPTTAGLQVLITELLIRNGPAGVEMRRIGVRGATPVGHDRQIQ